MFETCPTKCPCCRNLHNWHVSSVVRRGRVKRVWRCSNCGWLSEETKR